MDSILRIAIAGSVDDGKSTLLGRLLHDTGSLRVDQIDKMTQVGQSKGLAIDLASVTDGLKAEQEQGITIDVAYRYLDLDGRRVIFADTPGHEQYTRNMFTGASSAWASLLLVDAIRGLRDQTRRHAAIAALQGHQKLIFCVNKLDAMDYSQARFEALAAECQALADSLGIADISVIPLSALTGANVVAPHPDLAWFQGPTLLQLLRELAPATSADVLGPISIQSVLSEQRNGHTRRLLAVRFAGRALTVGESLNTAQGQEVRIQNAFSGGREVNQIEAGHDALIEIDREVDLTRGDWLLRRLEVFVDEIDVTLCWLDESASKPNQKVLVRHGDQWIRARLMNSGQRIDLARLCYHESDESIAPNELRRVRIKLAKAIPVSPFAVDRISGCCVLVDPRSNQTLAAGVVGSFLDETQPVGALLD